MVSHPRHRLISDGLATTVALRIRSRLQPQLRELKNSLRRRRYT